MLEYVVYYVVWTQGTNTDNVGPSGTMGNHLQTSATPYDDFYQKLPDKETLTKQLDKLAKTATDYEEQMDRVRQFRNERQFQAGGVALGVRRAHSANPAESFRGEFVSGNYFAMFGVSAYAGRAFTAADDEIGAPPVAVMSYRVWQQ